MRNPSDKDPDNAPPGGRAFQRVQQDRKARGLDALPTPEAEEAAPESEKSDPKQSPKTTKDK